MYRSQTGHHRRAWMVAPTTLSTRQPANPAIVTATRTAGARSSSAHQPEIVPIAASPPIRVAPAAAPIVPGPLTAPDVPGGTSDQSARERGVAPIRRPTSVAHVSEVAAATAAANPASHGPCAGARELATASTAGMPPLAMTWIQSRRLPRACSTVFGVTSDVMCESALAVTKNATRIAPAHHPAHPTMSVPTAVAAVAPLRSSAPSRQATAETIAAARNPAIQIQKGMNKPHPQQTTLVNSQPGASLR